MTYWYDCAVVSQSNSLVRRHSIASFSAAIFTAPLLFPAPAVGQQAGDRANQIDDSQIEEVIVTAQRRTQLLRDVPISLSVFSAEDIVQNNFLDVTDYFRRTPNVSFINEGTRGERNISIRGVHNIGGQVSALAFYVDEFNIVRGPRGTSTDNTNSSINPHLYDMERIEVLRGPQGTFFGRNATGGAVNLTTKKPAPEFYAEASAELGDFGTYAVGGVVNLPAAETFYLRGSAYYRQSDGLVKNVNPVGGRSDTEDLNVRVAARFVPSEQLTIDLSVNLMDDEQGLPQTVPTGILAGSSAGLLALEGIMEAIDGGLGFYPQNLSQVNHDLRTEYSNEYLTYIGRIEWDAGPIVITSVTGYFDAEHHFNRDHDFTSNGWIKFDSDIVSRSFSSELRLSSNTDGPFEWLVGGIYADDELDQLFGVRGGPDTFVGLPDDFPIDLGDFLYKTESYAVFGNATWHVNDQLSLMLGGRYSHDDVEQTIGGVNFGVPDVPGAGERSFSDFSPRLAATYKWTDEVTLYGTISKGYKAGGLQLNVTQQLPVVEFDSEDLWNYEGGIRFGAADGRIRTNLSVFYMDWKDMQVSTNAAVIDPDTNEITFINTTTNASSATSYGVEFDIQARPTDRLSLGGGVGYLIAEFDSFPDAVVEGQVTDLSGFNIPQAPEWTISADGQYTFPVFQSWEGFGRVEWSYRDDSVPSINSILQQGFPHIAESFQVWNFRLGTENANYRVEAFVQNAFDEQYFTKNNGFGFAGIQVTPQERYFGVRFLARTN